MKQFCLSWGWALLIALSSPPAGAQIAGGRDSAALQKFYDQTRPAMVAVKYQWESELSRQEIVGCGVVVREDGLVMFPMVLVSTFIPDAQMKDFKIIIPSDTDDQTEVKAQFVGRDERSEVAFVKPLEKRKWTAIHFEDRPANVGQAVYGIGLLPKVAGYKPYLTEAMVSAQLRGEIPQIMISGALPNAGSPVFDSDFHAIGVVEPQEGQEVLLEGPNELNGIVSPPHFFVPARFFLQSLIDPPTPDQPVRIPWIGVPEMTGVNQQFAEFLGLKNQPAVQIGDVVPGSPADKAGLVPGSIIIKINGQALERGDLPEELPMILRRHLIRMKVGEKVTFTVLPDKGQPTKDLTVTLEQRPREPNRAERFYVQDLGFVAREAVFIDTYTHKFTSDTGGVVVDLVRRSGAAATAKLAPEDWVMQVNGQHVSDLADFKQDYQAFRRDHPHDALVLVVHRRAGEEETINIEPPQSDLPPGAAGPGE